MPKCFLFWLIFSSYQCHLEASEATFERQWICSSFLKKPTQFFLFTKSQRDKNKYIIFQYLGYYLSTHFWNPFKVFAYLIDYLNGFYLRCLRRTLNFLDFHWSPCRKLNLQTLWECSTVLSRKESDICLQPFNFHKNCFTCAPRIYLLKEVNRATPDVHFRRQLRQHIRLQTRRYLIHFFKRIYLQ